MENDRGGAMTYYLCRHCGIIANTQPEGDCKASPSGAHVWVYGSSVDDFMLRNWKSPEGALAGITPSSEQETENIH
ncbi:MAG: hypothetical protein WC935_01750 [Thermoleophilia bacterium]